MAAWDCVCVSPPGERDAAVGWLGSLSGVCAWESSPRDVAAAVALAVHAAAWFVAVLPQLLLQSQLRWSGHLSLLYLWLWLLSDVCFAVATGLQRWAWMWIALRIWRATMTLALLAQTMWLRSRAAAADFAPAIEPAAVLAQDGFDIEHDRAYGHGAADEHERIALGWPAAQSPRKGRSQALAVNGNGSGSSSSSSASWGASLLANDHLAPLPATATVAGSPSRSRLPSSQQQLVQQHQPPRTVSPHNSPKISHVRSLSGSRDRLLPGGAASSSSVVAAPSSHATSVSSGLTSSTFHTSPGSAFKPVHGAGGGAPLDAAAADFTPAVAGGVSGSIHTTQSFSTSAVTITVQEVQPVGGLQSPDARSPSAAAAAAGKRATLYSVGFLALLVVGMLSVSGAQPSALDQTSPLHHPGRVLLAWDASASADRPLCNAPYHAGEVVSYVVRILSWLGCVLGCLALFPQFMFLDAVMRSTDGLSFHAYALMALANLAWILGTALPEHNDWLANRHAAEPRDDGGSGDSSWYLTHIQLPVLLVAAFNLLQIGVLVVQRRSYRKAAAARR